MDVTEARSIIKKRLSKPRYEHSIRVAETAVQLATMYNESTEKAALAGLLHDYAKCDPVHELRQQMKHYRLPTQLLEYNQELWHGPVGAFVVKDKYGLSDQDIFHSIYYHTTGRKNMSKLEKIIFVADYIEPGRKIPGIEEVREFATEDLERAAQKILRNTINYLLKKEAMIFPDTFIAYNELTKNMGGAN